MRFDTFDVALEFTFDDRLQEPLHLFSLPLHLKLNPAVLQVFHPTSHIVSACSMLHGVPESDALDASLIEYLACSHS